MDVFQRLPSNSVRLCLTSWEDLRKIIVDLHKSGSSLGAISKRLKVPRSLVQTTVHKYKHHGTTQPSYRSGRRRIHSPRDEGTLVRKVQINLRTTAKDLVKMLEETGTKVSIGKGVCKLLTSTVASYQRFNDEERQAPINNDLTNIQ